MGITRFSYYEKEGVLVRCCVCSVDVSLSRDSLFYRAVLWHEFCHTQPWLQSGRSDGHGEGFRRRLWRNKFLCIADLGAKFWYPLHRLRTRE